MNILLWLGAVASIATILQLIWMVFFGSKTLDQLFKNPPQDKRQVEPHESVNSPRALQTQNPSKIKQQTALDTLPYSPQRDGDDLKGSDWYPSLIRLLLGYFLVLLCFSVLLFGNVFVAIALVQGIEEALTHNIYPPNDSTANVISIFFLLLIIIGGFAAKRRRGAIIAAILIGIEWGICAWLSSTYSTGTTFGTNQTSVAPTLLAMIFFLIGFSFHLFIFFYDLSHR